MVRWYNAKTPLFQFPNRISPGHRAGMEICCTGTDISADFGNTANHYDEFPIPRTTGLLPELVT